MQQRMERGKERKTWKLAVGCYPIHTSPRGNKRLGVFNYPSRRSLSSLPFDHHLANFSMNWRNDPFNSTIALLLDSLALLYKTRTDERAAVSGPPGFRVPTSTTIFSLREFNKDLLVWIAGPALAPLRILALGSWMRAHMDRSDRIFFLAFRRLARRF